MSAPRIGGFEILERLGEGGMATVWKACQVSLDRIVAIKILRSQMEDTSEDAERFQSEARAAAKLKHPGIVQVHDAGTERGHFYFVMEYVAGYTVGDWIRRKGRLSEEEALVVAECVADALHYAWTTAGMIHCDIKPDNIIIDDDGTVKVADLGLSRTINEIGSAGVSDEVMGTPAYISPEQAEGKLDLDCRSDIYSLGAMLYHMVTGKLMFEGHSEEEVMELQVTTDPVDPKELNPDLTEGMHRLLSSMLSKDPARRPADWSEVASRLVEVREQVNAKSGGHASVKKIRINHDRLAEMASRLEAGRGKRAISRTSWLVLGVIVVAVLAVIVRQRREPAVPSARPAAVTPAPPAADADASPARPAQSAEDRAGSAAAVESPPMEGSDAGGTPGAAAPPEEETDPAAEMLAFARTWAAEHPGELHEAMRRFARVAEDTRGTKYALMAEDEIQRLERKLDEAKTDVMQDLAAQVKVAVETHDLLEAARIYEAYDGPWSDATHSERMTAANALRKRHRNGRMEATVAETRSQRKLRLAVRELADRLLEEGVAPALGLCGEFMEDPVLAPDRETLQDIDALLQQAAAVDQRILDSFRAQKGREVTVELARGPQTLTIVDVEGRTIIGRRKFRTGSGSASTEHVFAVGDLSARERMSRMGEEEEPDVALLKGLMAYRSKSYTHARRFFERTGTPLAQPLVRRVDLAENRAPPRPIRDTEGRWRRGDRSAEIGDR